MDTFDDRDTRNWAMLIHLSTLSSVVTAGLGFVLPVVLWQVRRESLPGTDAHGRMVANWLLSWLIYSVVAGLLVFVLIGIPLLVVLGLLSVVFPIVGGIKANNGELWRYPLTITFLK
ncbi:MAG: DUF4870 domain-containing protein [Planctomycetota bacterium]